MEDGEKLFLMDCRKGGVHRSCLKKRFPDFRNEQHAPCPHCHCLARASSQVIQRSQFSSTDAVKIDMCFIKHYIVSWIPMRAQEIDGLRIAAKIRGFRAMRDVSHRVFVVGLAFWFPLPKEKLCEWEDIALGLTLGLTWNMVSKMRTRYDLRVKRDGKGDDFHHFVDYLLDVCVEDDDLVSRACVVRSCSKCDSECEECKAFATIFDGERQSRFVAMANRGYFTSASRRRCLRSSRG